MWASGADDRNNNGKKIKIKITASCVARIMYPEHTGGGGYGNRSFSINNCPFRQLSMNERRAPDSLFHYFCFLTVSFRSADPRGSFYSQYTFLDKLPLTTEIDRVERQEVGGQDEYRD